MTGSLKFKLCILNFSSQLQFPEKDAFQAPGLLDIILKVTGSLKYERSILNFSSQLKFHEEDVF